MPKNASINADGFRMYEWPGGDSPAHVEYGATQPANLISVTSIRTLCGTPYQLVTWQINNILNMAVGQRRAEWRDYSKSKRGRLVKGYKKDGAFPGEFVTRMIETRGLDEPLRQVREWLKVNAEEPRDVAAVRGSVVHKLIELNATLDKCDEELIRARFDEQWAGEDRKVPPDVTADDVAFVRDGMAQYWDMREHVPFVVIAQEPQVFNLEAGYAGSTDVILWFLGAWEGDTFVPLPDVDQAYWQREAWDGTVTLARIKEVGGTLAVGDWKTSPDIYTGHVVQITAYMGGRFIGRDGQIDVRLTEILVAARLGMTIKIRPGEWKVAFFEFQEEIMYAFLGSCAFARFLAKHKRPDDLFFKTLGGSAPDTEPEEADDAA